MIKFTTDYNDKENRKFLVNQLMQRTPIISDAQIYMVLFDLIVLIFVLCSPD